MSGFIASGTANHKPSGTLTNNGFYPDIDLEHARKSLRLDGAVTDERLEQAAISAVLDVNHDLQPLAAKYKDFSSLADVPSDQVGGDSALLHLYRRAVYCSIGAEIAERYRSYDSTAQGNQRADDLTPSIDEYRRDSRFAIRDLLKRVRVTVELI